MADVDANTEFFYVSTRKPNGIFFAGLRRAIPSGHSITEYNLVSAKENHWRTSSFSE